MDTHICLLVICFLCNGFTVTGVCFIKNIYIINPQFPPKRLNNYQHCEMSRSEPGIEYEHDQIITHWI